MLAAGPGCPQHAPVCTAGAFPAREHVTNINGRTQDARIIGIVLWIENSMSI